MPRISGQTDPRIPTSAPLSYRLSEEVYSLDGLNLERVSEEALGAMKCVTGPAVGPTGRGHMHEYTCEDGMGDAGDGLGAYDEEYLVAPGARLGVGPHGRLVESMGADPYMTEPMLGQTDWKSSTPFRMFVYASSLAMVYHGYKRNKSVLWGLLWGLTGPLGIPFAVAQGFGKRKKR